MCTSCFSRGLILVRKVIFMTVLALSANIAYADRLQPDNGSGMVAGNIRDHLTMEQRTAISQELARNRMMLRDRGLLITEKA